MADEITRYDGKVKTLLLARELKSKLKWDPKHVKVTSKNIILDGKKETFQVYSKAIKCDWDITISLSSIKNVFYQSFKAEGAMNYDKDAVGVEAVIDGALINYAILVDKPEPLFQVIQDSRPTVKE